MPKTITDARVRSGLSFRILLLTHQSQPNWGSMTAGQMLRHVAVGMEQGLGRCPDQDASNFLLRTLGKVAILRILPKMPRGLPTSKAMKQTGVVPDLAEFDSDRDRVLTLLEESGNWPGDRSMPNHPALGRLNNIERGILTWKHLDHHLRQFGV